MRTPTHAQTVEEAEYYDGPGFVEWLAGERKIDGGPGDPVDPRLTPTNLRRISDWRRGHKVHYATADKLLNRLGLHLSFVPDELLVVRKVNGSVRVRPKVKLQIVSLYRAGKTAKELSSRYGYHESTIRRWANARGTA